MLKLISQLEHFKTSIQRVGSNEELQFQEYDLFREFITEYNETDLIEELLSSASDILYGFQQFFGDLEKRYIKSMEYVNANHMLSAVEKIELDKLPIKSRVARHSNNQVEHELGLLDIARVKTLVMIGSGPFPKSLIEYALNTSIAEIVGIDYDKKAIEIAETLLQKLDLVHRIAFVHTKAEDYDYACADVVIVGNFVTPKLPILKQVAHTIKPDAKILLRVPTLLDKLVYEAVPEKEISTLNLKVEKVLDKVFYIGDSTLLLRKK